jgi:hypothetical protein
MTDIRAVPFYVTVLGPGSGQVFSTSFTQALAASAQDVLAIKAPADRGIAIHELLINNGSGAGSTLNLAYTDGTTDGSGGAALTPTPWHPDAAAAAGTYQRQNTTQATVATEFLAITIANGATWSLLSNIVAGQGNRFGIAIPRGRTFVLRGTPNAGAHTVIAYVEEIR